MFVCLSVHSVGLEVQVPIDGGGDKEGSPYCNAGAGVSHILPPWSFQSESKRGLLTMSGRTASQPVTPEADIISFSSAILT